MELHSYPGEKGYFPPVYSEETVEYADAEAETEELMVSSQSTAMPPMKNKKVQSDIASKARLGEVDLTDFLHATMPLMLEQLAKETKAFQCTC